MRRERWLPFGRRPPADNGQDTASSDRLRLADVRSHANGPDTEFSTDWDDLSGVEVVAGELVTITTDTGGAHHEPITALLQQVRSRTGMDVVFVSQFVNGRRLIRHVAADAKDPHRPVEGVADPLEETYCQRVLDGRLPGALRDALDNREAAQLPITQTLDVRAHVAVPIITADGRVFGTVCAYAHGARREVNEALGVVNAVAHALASALDKADED
jgi:hypothetical protein